MKFVTRPALKRLAVLFLVLGGLFLWFWWTMIRMPLTSYGGPLPALSAGQTALRDELRRHVEKLARETPDKLDYDRMARVVDGLEKVILDLVSR